MTYPPCECSTFEWEGNEGREDSLKTFLSVPHLSAMASCRFKQVKADSGDICKRVFFFNL